MGLTHRSVGRHASCSAGEIRRQNENEYVIALAGNPNVGKSTVFNALTGMNQHTGNWPGKTVTNAQGEFRYNGAEYILVDLPGTYSLAAHSPEEEVARDFICFGGADATVVVCDATCLERNLNLVLQIIECSPRVVVCVNLMDEAKRKHIAIDLRQLEECLGVPVVSTVARKKRSLTELCRVIERECASLPPVFRTVVEYPPALEEAIEPITQYLLGKNLHGFDARWLALRILDDDAALTGKLTASLGTFVFTDPAFDSAVGTARNILAREDISPEQFRDLLVSAPVRSAEKIARGVIRKEDSGNRSIDRALDRILTSKRFGYPLMLLLLALIFWLTIGFANIPSGWLASCGDALLVLSSDLLSAVNAPPWLSGMIVDGILRVLFTVISVMLPPMAIFFPLFTLLEDFGYLPRVAYNLDRPFHRCNACGKQALTMCMGFGCNAAGVVGCRIIDSPRERLLAILTNSFVPCNGRFPALIAILSMFFMGGIFGWLSSFLSALCLALLILFCVLMTFLATKFLSLTFLRGTPSSFTLELPPYRRPQFCRVIVRSVFDRTLFVLARSVAVAAPAGLLLWILANVSVGDSTVLSLCSGFLDPFARLLGMDGVILMAFILAFPANEIVFPIILMGYLSGSTLVGVTGYAAMKEILVANGWDARTALCVLIFFLFHWPCSTTLLTVRKETGSLRWTLLAFALPSSVGILLCMLVNAVLG